MDLSFTKEDLEFQQEVRDWIAEAYTPELRAKMAMSKNGYLDKEGQVEWQKRLYEKGWVAPNWPEKYGGPGLSPSERYILNMELSAAGTPTVSPMGISMVAPVLMAFGSEEQKAKYLPPILRSDVWWCQGYSEPGAGSDLASLQMSAVRDGDDYVLNGSKIWTTHAQWADMIFCLVRTSKEGKTQEGISFIVFPMTTPGITISALPTLDGPLEGQQEINQVFFENVRVPIAEALVGEENKGWTYAKYLLQFERGNAYAPGLRNMLRKARKIASLEQSEGEALIRDHDFSRKLANMEIKIDSLDATEQRIFSALSAGQAVGPESSMLKCEGSDTQQAITELILEATGSYAAPFIKDSFAVARAGANADLPMPQYAVPVAPSYFNYRKTSIYAGSNEIQRNIMAKMVLGL
ncbi:acyl-CoA dehydrogenase family protein [Hyphomonas sp.]|uniref:acyl-CoA dehydrogenase family protein n=1 Tax=Hyphomonas sp. TaxID=87 RepID=UPI0030033544|tara:strand:- start:2903 stop:4126 length:1224 start_codon:yes stop_codon:yes gene_type:complete|eukprot:TRINITY_DN12673_c0_g1_i1.p1 TRINITY_DN12673_c0_g1~~TRINITY_DN12673_c0_g1_i1.p1  ORF type:complete len:408 (+),score=83.13 TRINITY_DN12673_c0_g1_i1:3178-4401(+)